MSIKVVEAVTSDRETAESDALSPYRVKTRLNETENVNAAITNDLDDDVVQFVAERSNVQARECRLVRRYTVLVFN